MKQHFLLLPILSCVALFPALPSAAQDAGPPLEETRRFIQGVLQHDGVFATVGEERESFILRTTYAFGGEISPVPRADGCTLSFAENYFSAATRKEAAAMNFPQQSRVTDIFIGGNQLRVDASKRSDMDVVTVTSLGGDDFVSTRTYKAVYESSGNTGGYVRQREDAQNNGEVTLGVVKQDDAIRLKKAFEHMAALCADAKAPEGFGKSLF